jgi:hypothetical protein
MKRTAVCAALTLLLTCCLDPIPLRAQLPGYTGGPASAGTARAAALPLYATRHREFAIPFSVDRRVAQPIEVHLYVSVDQGTNWQLQARQPPGARQFIFRAAGDGEYWFASRTIDAAQRAGNAAAPRPEFRVVVDTVAPQIELSARPTKGGQVTTAWQLFDQNLLVSTLKIEYQDGVGKPWQPVTLQLPKDDVVRTSYGASATWWPNTSSPTINVRAEVRDRAGNLATASRRLLLPAVVTQQQPHAAGRSDALAAIRRPSEGGVPWPSDNRAEPPAPHAGTSPYAQAGRPFGNPPLPRPTPNDSLPLTDSKPGVPAQTASAKSVSQEGQPTPLPPPPSQRLANNVNPLPTVPAASNGPNLGFPEPPSVPIDSPRTPGGPSQQDVAAMLPEGERPQMTRSPRFQLEYDVDSVGASGVAEVQLWATADAGRTWRMWGTDDDLESPFDVAVQQEGIFGFHVVVVGKNGMAGRRPRMGDLADIWVGVDTTPPTAELTAATYGEGADAGKLVIQWRAADQYLDARPVTLSFSETPDGPWTRIVSALRNTGRFAWPADPQLPSAVYLKLEVRDEAGNVSSDQTPSLVRIDGLAPKARIRGIQPLPELDREAFRVPRRR